MDNILFADIARYLYEDMQRISPLIKSPYVFGMDFSDLSLAEKQVWEKYVSQLEEKLKAAGFLIRPYKDFCRTCIITDEEIGNLAASDNKRFALATQKGKVLLTEKTNEQISPERIITVEAEPFFRELNYLIPLQMKRMGFEILRPEEASAIDNKLIKKIARAIHSGYLKNMWETGATTFEEKPVKMSIEGDNANPYLADFDDLPEEIRYSNIDNAYHIPTKLLAVGYRLRAIKKGFKSLALVLSDEEVESMAGVEHMRWSWDKRLNGWIYGYVKDSLNKIHPGLIAYEELTEQEKEKDRELVRMIPALLQDIGYEVYHVNPEQIRNISYAIKPQSIIYRILHETREMNDQIRKMVSLTPVIEEMIKVRNSKIEEAITEVRESYNYAHHIQETFLPDGLYVRECFPESFVLFKPKDIVSGDFYFFSRKGELVIFAAADCTGHGIPGALLSTIGYGIIDQAVNELKLTDPSDILYHLYSRVHRFLRRDSESTGVPDDMDIALCVFNAKANILKYSGVKNPLYIISGGGLIEYPAQNLPEGCEDNGECRFLSDTIKLRYGDTIYLGSDGFADQFGGKSHKKYQRSRYKEFLIGIQDYSMPEQSDMLYEETERWRGVNNEDQTDDILVIGIKI